MGAVGAAVETGEVVEVAGAEVEGSRGPAGRLHTLILYFSLLAATT